MTDPDRGLPPERLRALLNDAVADVQPPPALHRIRSRTKVTPMRHTRPWLLVAAGAVAATAATVGVVALADGRSPQAGPGPAATSTADPSDAVSAEPSDGASPSEDPTPEPTDRPAESPSAESPEGDDTALLPVYFIGDTPAGPRLFREFHRAPASTGPGVSARLLAALETAMAGQPLDPDYRTGWPGAGDPGGPMITSAGFGPATADGVPVVTISSTMAPGVCRCDEEFARLAIQQLVYTAQAVVQERVPVVFLGEDGEALDTLLGVDVSQGAKAAPALEVQAPVWITTPQDGQEVGRASVLVQGVGSFFEANVSWQLLREDGSVVKEGFATAEECCTLAPYAFQFAARPGDYLLRVYAADMSGGEGPGEPEDTKRITVR